MNETKRWIHEARGHLQEARKSGRARPSDALREHMKRIDFDRALADLGCGDQCEVCSWGSLGGYALRQTCELVAFLHALEDLHTDQRRDSPAEEETLSLLAMLDRLSARGEN